MLTEFNSATLPEGFRPIHRRRSRRIPPDYPSPTRSNTAFATGKTTHDDRNLAPNRLPFALPRYCWRLAQRLRSTRRGSSRVREYDSSLALPAPECEAKWSAARAWVIANADFSLRTDSESRIDTLNADSTRSGTAVQVDRIEGQNGESRIVVDIECFAAYGCPERTRTCGSISIARSMQCKALAGNPNESLPPRSVVGGRVPADFRFASPGRGVDQPVQRGKPGWLDAQIHRLPGWGEPSRHIYGRRRAAHGKLRQLDRLQQ